MSVPSSVNVQFRYANPGVEVMIRPCGDDCAPNTCGTVMRWGTPGVVVALTQAGLFTRPQSCHQLLVEAIARGPICSIDLISTEPVRCSLSSRKLWPPAMLKL